MTVEIIPDRVDGNRGIYGPTGWREKSLTLHVGGLTVTTGRDDILAEALAAIQGEGYITGAEHPYCGGLKLVGDIALQAVDSHSVDAVLTYRVPTRPEDDPTDPEFIRVRGSVTLAQERTNQDAAGADIYTEWKPSSSEDAKKQPGMVDVWLPCQRLDFSKALLVNPAPVARDMVGKVNSDTFQGDPAGYWLCHELTFESSDGGVTWPSGMAFVRHPDMWRETVYYLLESGAPPANWNESYNAGKTVKKITVYGSTAFASLGLPNVME